MSIWSYGTLTTFQQGRIGSSIISFNDLLYEINVQQASKDDYCWVARKNKQEYLVLNSVINKLPIRIKDTTLIKDRFKIYHFITSCSHIGFIAEKHYSFRKLTDKFFNVVHDNNNHFILLKLIALSSYILRVNARICSNIEFGKDATFEVLNYLTNSIAVFDKPRTMAKLEYGVVNQILMVNELVPKTEEEKRSINEFLLSIGSLKPIYQKTTRGSLVHSTRDYYDINNLSLIICYNSIEDISERDKPNYFDYVFGRNIKERYIPFKFSGKLDVEQFIKQEPYSIEIDRTLINIARTIEYYKQHYKEELKPYTVNLNNLQLSGRQKISLQNIIYFINLYSNTEEEFKMLVNRLLECHYAYKRMLSSSKLVTDYTEQQPEFTNHKEELQPISPEIEDLSNNKPSPMDFIKIHKNEECDTQEFADEYGDDVLNKLLKDGDIFESKAGKLKVLE